MLFATAGQGPLFLWMMAAGALAALWYLATAGLRHLLQAGFWITLACDLLFGMGTAVILIIFVIIGNYGSLRPFLLVAMAMGAGICFFALRAPLNLAGRALGSAKRRIVTALTQNRLLKVIFK